MKRTLVPLVLLVAACATPGEAPMVGTGMDVPASKNPTGMGGEFHLQPDLVTASLEVPGPPDAVWPALLQVYEELKIPVREVNEATRVVRNSRFVVSRRLGGKRLSTYLECGRSASGANADSFRLELEIASRVVGAGSGASTIQTEMAGTGQNMEGTSNNRVTCTSNHQLEFEIAARVRALLGSGF